MATVEAGVGGPADSAVRPASPGRRSFPTGRAGWMRRAPLLPALVFAIIVTQLPFLFTLWYSLNSWNLVRPGSRRFVGLENYARVFTDSTFRGAALNTVLITGSAVIVSMVLGVALAVLLDRKFLGRSVVRTMLITPFLVMPVAAALLWKTSIFDPVFGLLNFVLSPFGAGETEWVSSYPRVVVIAELVWQWTPFMMLIVLAGLQSQSKDVLEAAQVDGASAFRTFRSVTLPHLRRYIELGVLLGAIYLVNTFDAIYMMTQGGPGTASSNLPFYLYQRAFLGFDVGQAAALGVVVVAGTIIVATVALRLIFTRFTGEQA
jgi:sorbitol/mannitol transport system permease protein